ncbi:hypothetical protein [Mumia sp. DW29H23]|uniref:hypothetical protein n=1 Tax=Mumia sp. DW29H23 TaxID=3421241 RepID=UPI003D68C54E
MSHGPIRKLMVKLNPLLVRAGFSEAQGGGDTALYCAAFDDIADRYPHLPQAHDEQAEAMSFACVDLTFDLAAGGLLKSIQFESYDLEDTLALTGATDDAWLVLNAYDQPVGEVVDTLHNVLARLFATQNADRPRTYEAGVTVVDDQLEEALRARRQRRLDDPRREPPFA